MRVRAVSYWGFRVCGRAYARTLARARIGKMAPHDPHRPASLKLQGYFERFGLIDRPAWTRMDPQKVKRPEQ